MLEGLFALILFYLAKNFIDIDYKYGMGSFLIKFTFNSIW